MNRFDNPSMWQEDYYDEDQFAELYDMMMAEKRKRGPPVVSESPQEERLRKRNNITPEPAQYPLQNFPAPPKKPTPDVVMPDVVPTLVERPHYEMKVPIKERAEGFHILDKLDEIPVSIKFSELLANAPTLRKEVTQALTSHRQEKKINIASTSLSNTTSLSAPVRVEGIATKAFIDTSAAISAVSNQFRKKFGFDVTRAASYKICGIDGRKIVPLGEIDGFPLTFGKVTVPITVVVIDASNYDVILGKDWLTKLNAAISYKNAELLLQITWNGRSQTVVMECHNAPQEYTEESD